MLTIGITGPIGHGKSTFAEALQKLEPSTYRIEFSTVVIEIANAMHAALRVVPPRDDISAINDWLKALPAILLQSVHLRTPFSLIMLNADEIGKHPIEYEKLFLHLDSLGRNPKLARTSITRANKEEYRPFLQWLGGYLVQKVDPAIWQREIITRLRRVDRGHHRLCVVGGLRFPEDATALRGIGAKILKVYRPGHLQYDVLDPTERERGNIQVDSTIMSDGTIDDLTRCAARVLQDLRSGNLQKLYRAKSV